MAEFDCDRIISQIDGLKVSGDTMASLQNQSVSASADSSGTLQGAFHSLLLLDEAFISTDDATNPAVAEAINKAFEEHVPRFNYKQQVRLVLEDAQLF